MKQPFPIHVILGLLIAVCTLSVVGCKPEQDSSETSPVSSAPQQVTLHVLTVDDEVFAPLIKRYWTAEGNLEPVVTNVSSTDFLATDFQLPDDCDVIVFPTSQFVELVTRNRLAEISSELLDKFDYRKETVFSHLKTELPQINRATFAVPLGSPQMCLMYRNDILQGLGIDAPSSWDEFRELLQTRQQADSKLDLVLLEPLAGDWAAHSFLTRVASRVRGAGRISTLIDVETAKPLIGGEPFVSTLQEMVEQYPQAPSEFLAPADVFRAICDGKAEIALGWPSVNFDALSSESSQQIRIARVPGSKRWYDPSNSRWFDRDDDGQTYFDYIGFEGRMAGISKNSRYLEEATRFAAWLSGNEASRKIGIESNATSIYRSSQMGAASAWAGDALSDEAALQYFEALMDSNRDRLCFLFPRVPNQADYVSSLAEAVRSALTREKTVESALATAAEKWSELIEKTGVDEVRKWTLAGENF
ncbi:MAG: extracellular solute-binding protein [Pirellulaceae bacterium]